MEAEMKLEETLEQLKAKDQYVKKIDKERQDSLTKVQANCSKFPDYNLEAGQKMLDLIASFGIPCKEYV
ncbi:hypothetical protein ACH5RR_003344 [Cinchona calisaya]|uniref:Uncharacterized protein n=1 Tax=Cinchona calisaya TaxID=153742 RepID=A0ABD3AUP8_9GENT